MKIISLSAENVKRLVAVEITPAGNMVQITGKNGQGKTSVLDSIWWALAGAGNIQTAPIRKGANEARIKLDLGDIKVVRKFKRDKETGEETTSLVVENEAGARFPSPQKMLDSLLGTLSFDPLAFARMDANAQFEAMRRFVPDVDFKAIDRANADDFARRTGINRRAKELRAQAQGVVMPPKPSGEPVDETALIAQLDTAGKTNTEIETRKARREAAQNDANVKKAAGVAYRDDAAKRRTDANAEFERDGKAASEAYERAKAAAAEALKTALAAADKADRNASAILQVAAEIEKKIDEAEALPKPVDTADLLTQINAARTANAAIKAFNEAAEKRKACEQDADAQEKQSAELTAVMEGREKTKKEAIAKAQLPVAGIEFGADTILLNGVPFDQASDAEKLRTSVAIAMASNPELRVIRVRDGSLLDEDAMTLLEEMANSADYQVWIERVDGSGKVGVVLENGSIKQ